MTSRPNIPEDPPSAERNAALRRGLALLNSGAPKEALALLTCALEEDPGDPQAALALAAAAFRTGDFELALEQFTKTVVKDAPSTAKALHGAGLALFALERRGEALSHFRRAAEADPGAWKTWDSIADMTEDECERVRALERSADALLEASSRRPARPAIYRDCARRLIDAGRPSQVIAFVEAYRTQFADSGEADTRIANAYYNLGKFRQAFAAQARATAETLPRPAGLASATARFDPHGAAEALADVTAFFAARGLQLFLTAGTLLGFLRHGRPLPHDRDVDAGILADQQGRPDIAAVLRSHPGLTMPRSARRGERYFGIVYKGTAIDIFIHERRADRIVCGFSDMPGDIAWGFDPFELAEADYSGRTWKVPQNPEQFLAQTYGTDWRTPDPGFASVLSSPALLNTSRYARAFYAAARARQAVLNGKLQKAAALARQSPLPFALPEPGG